MLHNTSKNSKNSNSNHIVTLYKPCGLPCFAQSQVNKVNYGHELFSLHTLTTSSNLNWREQVQRDVMMISSQPAEDDSSDALFSRVKDACLPGRNTFHLVYPIPSPLLLQSPSKHSMSTTM
uniref:Uncharacterized protein n=1 Tax=Lygus hesperus TaxID=30085 RepID=A0A0A9ZFS6_LYGHE